MIRSSMGNLTAASPWLGARMTPQVRALVKASNGANGQLLSIRPVNSGSRQSFTYSGTS